MADRVESTQKEREDDKTNAQDKASTKASSIPYFPTTFTSNDNNVYDILPEITLKDAGLVQEQTGLVIPFEPGESTRKFIGGKGSFGELRLCNQQSTGNYFGVKIIKISSKESAKVESSSNEAVLQQKLNGLPHLMPLIATGSISEKENTILYQVMPLAGLGDGKDLKDYLKSTDPIFKEQVLIHVTKNILEGLSAMHNMKEPIVHLDFKPGNLVIDKEGEVWIIDFGCSQILSSTGKIEGEGLGDPRYLSPERTDCKKKITNEFPGKEADSWALGLTLLEMVTGNQVDKDRLLPQSNKKKLANPKKYNIDYLSNLLTSIKSKEYRELIEGFLKIDPSKRTKPAQALENPLFQQEPSKQVVNYLKELVQNMQLNKKKKGIHSELSKLKTSPQQLPLAHFTGYVERPALERELLEKLLSTKEDVDPLVACTGMGGVGKTQLLTYFVYHEEIKKSFKQIFWFQAADIEASLLGQYQALAKEINLVDRDIKAEEAKEKLLEWFEINEAPTLLVFDNAENKAVLEPYLPKKGCHILVSSRSPKNWKSQVKVDIFDKEQVLQLLNKLLPERENSLEEANLLGDSLDFLPLALSQAIALIRRERLNLDDFISTFKSKKENLLTANEQLFGKQLPNSILTLYQIQLDKLKSKLPVAKILLEYASLLAPNNIPFPLLTQILKDKDIYNEDIKQAFEILYDYNLWQKDKDDLSMHMHRLIQEVIKLNINSELLKDQFLHLAKLIRVEYYKEAENILLDEARQKMLVPHMEALQQLVDQKDNDDLRTQETYANLLVTIGNYYNFQIGDYKKAISLYEHALPLQEQHYEEENPEVAATLNNMGSTYGKLGKPKQQIDSLERALDIKKKYYGEFHPEVASTLVNLGNAYGNQGNQDKKIEMLEQAYRIDSFHYGFEALRTSITLSNLGAAYMNKGDYLKAESKLKKALEIHENCYGKEHHKLGIILMNLGVNYLRLKIFDKAQESLERALKVQEKQYGRKSTTVAETMVNLGIAYFTNNEYKEAEIILKEGLGIQEKYFGENSYMLTEALVNLAILYCMLKYYNKAETYIKRAIVILEAIDYSLEKSKITLAKNILEKIMLKQKSEMAIEQRLLDNFSRLKISQNCEEVIVKVSMKGINESDLINYCKSQLNLNINSGDLEFDEGKCLISLNKEAIKALRDKLPHK